MLTHSVQHKEKLLLVDKTDLNRSKSTMKAITFTEKVSKTRCLRWDVTSGNQYIAIIFAVLRNQDNKLVCAFSH